MLNIILTKVCALMALFVLTLLASIISSQIFYYWKKRRKSVDSLENGPSSNKKSNLILNPFYIELFRSFNCGMLLSVLFLHLIPIARKHFHIFFIKFNNVNIKNEILIKNISTDHFEYRGIPCVELIICITFFTIYFVEEIVKLIFHHKKYYWFHSIKPKGINYIHCGDYNCALASLDYRLNKTKSYLITCSRKTSRHNSATNSYDSFNCHCANNTIRCETSEISHDSLEDFSLPPLSSSTPTPRSCSTPTPRSCSTPTPRSCSTPTPRSCSTPTPRSCSISNCNSSLDSPSYWNTMNDNKAVNVYLPQLTLSASMPVYSVLEGIVIASQDTISLIWLMFFVILLHKITTSIVLSLQYLSQTNSKTIPTLTLIMFSLLPIIGFFIVFLSNTFYHSSFTKCVIQLIFSSLSCGVVLHIVFLCMRQNLCFIASIRNGIIQHFIMYSGFILILACTLILKIKSKK